MMKRLYTACLLLVCACMSAHAEYTKREVMIPMRDSVRLYTAIYEPTDASGPRPVIIRRSPYGCKPYGEGFSKHLYGQLKVFTDHGYIVVLQDARGFYESEGPFEHVRPLDPQASHGPADGNLRTDEATDTYDTIEWLLANTANNGNFGVTGFSYTAFFATTAAVCGHPALKAVSPQAPVTDWYIGDDVHYCGAYLYDKEKPLADSQFMSREFCSAHPDYDAFWQARTPVPHLRDVKPAVLVVCGAYDDEDCYGALAVYKGLLRQSPDTETYFVYGPWYHGAWHDYGYDGYAGYRFGPGTPEWFSGLEYSFFAHYLEGEGPAPQRVSLIASFFDENASWTAETFNEMPEYEETPLYLGADGSASFDRPRRLRSRESYISDPADPVPFAEPGHTDFGIEDQRFVMGRSDVRCFSSPAVEDTLKLAGPLTADIWFKTDAADLDFVVKLIDVRPDGSQMTIRNQVFRARYRKGFRDGHDFLKPRRRCRLRFEMNDVVHNVLPGHSMMVQIQNSLYPFMEVNPQTAVDNIYYAAPEDYKAAEVTIMHERRHPSALVLPVRR